MIPESSWHSIATETVATQLKVDPKQGLDADEARLRLTQNGPNALNDAKPVNPWALLVEQFKSPLVGLLLIAALVSGFLSEWVDSIAISTIVILNAIIGFFQEYNAEKAIAALKKMTAPSARVLRGGQSILIPATDVVAGDILLLPMRDCCRRRISMCWKRCSRVNPFLPKKIQRQRCRNPHHSVIASIWYSWERPLPQAREGRW